MNKVLFLSWIILFQGLVIGASKRRFNPRNSVVLDHAGKVVFRWNFTHKIFKFEVIIQSTGWIGIGFSPSGTMKGADIIFAWMQDGVPHVLDMHAAQNGIPRIDARTNFRDFRMKQNGTHTTLYINRFLNTCDERHDFAITEDTTRVIYAYGKAVPDGELPSIANYHGTNRGVRSLRLLDRKPQNLLPLAIQNDDVISYELRTAPFRIPRRDTYYHCFYHKLPELEEKHHIIQFEAILTPENRKNIHHITMFHCEETLVTGEMLNSTEECYVDDQGDHWHYCSPVIFAWTVGMTTFTLPEHVGFPLGVPGAPKIVKMEIHYDNLALERGIIDTSGLRIFYTKKIRNYDSGILLTGHDVVPTLFVPQGSRDFVVQGHCSTQCLEKILQHGNVSVIKAFGVFLHSHTAGHGMILRHYRNGTELKPLARDLVYDFNYQETKLLHEERNIEIGDNLIMECVYDTTKRTLPTLGGLGTRDEMCFGFIMYYPKIADAYCQSSPSAVDMLVTLKARTFAEAYYNAMIKNWTDGERQEFNQKQLSNRIWQQCRTLKGPIEGVKSPGPVPTVKAKFLENPGRCEIRKSKGDQTRPHDVIKRSRGIAPNDEYMELLKSDMVLHKEKPYSGEITFLSVCVGTISAVAVLTIVGMIYYKSGDDRTLY